MRETFSDETRFQLQRLSALFRSRKRSRASPRSATRASNCWPTCRTPGRPGLLEEQKQSIRDALAKHKLTISNINAFMMNAIADPRQPYWHPSWIEPDPHYRAIRREHTKRALQLARDLGAPHITTEPGGPLATGQTWQNGADIFYDELMPCIEVAEKLGVPLLIEPEPGL